MKIENIILWIWPAFLVIAALVLVFNPDGLGIFAWVRALLAITLLVGAAASAAWALISTTGEDDQ